MGISVKIPLQVDETYGFYGRNSTLLETIKQDMRMLLLTSPGERPRDTNYGVGLRRFLFEQSSEVSKIYGNIKQEISEKTKKYMNYITIQDVQFEYDNFNRHLVRISVQYFINSLNVYDFLELG